MDHLLRPALRPAVAGTLTAIVITTTMDATGYAVFSALPLILLTGLFWFLQKFTRKEIGLTWGDWTSYGWALAYPLLVLGLAAAIAAIFGAIDSSEADWDKTLFNIGIMSSIGVLMVMITEEGFFRGWLWASLKRSGKSGRFWSGPHSLLLPGTSLQWRWTPASTSLQEKSLSS